MRAMRILGNTGRRAGFTILEASIAITVIAIVILSVTTTVDRSGGAFTASTSAADLDALARRALDRVARDLATVVGTSLSPNGTLPGQSVDSLDYRTNTGWNGAAVTTGLLNRIERELDPAELDDGLDNDSDGLVDEGVLVWREDPGQPGERSTRRASYVAELLEGETANGVDDNGNGLVDESGFCIQITGNVMTLRLTLQRVDATGQLLTSTVETSVLIRN